MALFSAPGPPGPQKAPRMLSLIHIFGLLCRNIYEKKKITQRELAAAMDLSLGTCNHLIRDALADGLIALDPQTGEYSLLKKGVELLQK